MTRRKSAPALTPKRLVEWAIALAAVVLMLMFILTLGDDLFLIRDFSSITTVP
jgi:hypothetical protein